MHEAEQIIGCLVGGAIGDCLGGPYEGRHAPVMIDYQKKWRLSDDTLHTLATCEAISSNHKPDPASIASTFAALFKEGRLSGLGASSYKALSELSIGGHWALVGMQGERSAGDGAAMRIAPLAFWLDPTNPKARTLIRDVCRITHHNGEAYVGALAVTCAIRAAWDQTWNGEEDLFTSIVEQLPDSSVRDRMIQIMKVAEANSISAIAERFGCTGYVVDAVPLALAGAQRIRVSGFQGMLEELIACGGDTDTIASIAGQIAGALIGYTALPEELRDRLPNLPDIVAVARTYTKVVESQFG